MRYLKPTLFEIARFWRNVDVRGPQECWLWEGPAGQRKRGSFTRDAVHNDENGAAKTTPAHFALMLKIERAVGHEKFALHLCDVPLCCNMRHLYEGDRKDNARDAAIRGRLGKWSRAEKRKNPEYRQNGAKLTAGQVSMIKALMAKGHTDRVLATRYGVSAPAIRKIRVQENWAWVTAADE